MRQFLIVVGVIAWWSPAARADAFGGWRYTVPQGFTATQSGDHVEFMRITAPTFCQLGLFATRAMTQPQAAEAAFEWQNVVEKTFEAAAVKRLGGGRSRSGLPYESTGAQVRAGGNSFYAQLHVVTPAGLVSSVLVVSNSADTIGQCAPAVKALLDTLTADATPKPAPAKPPAGSPVGRWASSVAGQPNDGSPSIRRQYVLAGDGTYSHHTEVWGGAYRPDEWTIVDEVGKYAVVGDKLTISPGSARGVTRSRKAVTKAFEVPLEKVTYTWRLHYLAGIQENNLLLTPPAKTRRDGEFASNDQFPSSYFLSAKYKPQWDFPP